MNYDRKRVALRWSSRSAYCSFKSEIKRGFIPGLWLNDKRACLGVLQFTAYRKVRGHSMVHAERRSSLEMLI